MRLRYLIIAIFALTSISMQARANVCDVDADGDIDRLDIRAISGSRNTPASGVDDPKDADGDGVITILDARQCVVSCTLARCAEPAAISGRDVTSLMLDGTNDTDSDGIRDDVNTFIDENFSQTSTVRDAAHRYAKSINGYSTSMTSEEAGEGAVELQKSIECIYLYLPENSDGSAAHEMISSLEGETFNSKERAMAWYGTDTLLSTTIISAINPAQSDCF